MAQRRGTPTAPSALDRPESYLGPNPLALLAALGSVVYFAETHDGLIKIGFTTNLAKRRLQLGGVQLLAFRFGTYADEQAIHAGLVAHRARGREWYHPTPEVLAVVDAAREAMRALAAA